MDNGWGQHGLNAGRVWDPLGLHAGMLAWILSYSILYILVLLLHTY